MEMKNCKKTIDDLEVAEYLLHRARKELLDYYSDDKGIIDIKDYNDALQYASKFILESQI